MIASKGQFWSTSPAEVLSFQEKHDFRCGFLQKPLCSNNNFCRKWYQKLLAGTKIGSWWNLFQLWTLVSYSTINALKKIKVTQFTESLCCNHLVFCVFQIDFTIIQVLIVSVKTDEKRYRHKTMFNFFLSSLNNKFDRLYVFFQWLVINAFNSGAGKSFGRSFRIC